MSRIYRIATKWQSGEEKSGLSAPAVGRSATEGREKCVETVNPRNPSSSQ